MKQRGSGGRREKSAFHAENTFAEETGSGVGNVEEND
jgi:hypothetical protein